MSFPNTFFQLQKADLTKRQVWGFAAVEQPDSAVPPEIMDYAKSKPHFLKWSDTVQKASQGKSLGNVRAMHGGQMLAVGRVIHLEPRDVEKAFYIGVEVVDDAAWEKVQKGVYTGFSIGGKYGAKWPDDLVKGATRYEAIPNEISLVDLPCIPGATYEVIKADGASELRKFALPADEEQPPAAGDQPPTENNQPPAEGENPEPETETETEIETETETPESAPSGAEGKAPELQASLDVEAVKQVVVTLLMDLGLVQPSGAQPMSMAIKLDSLNKAVQGTSEQLSATNAQLQKALDGQRAEVETLRKTLANDIAQIALAVQTLEKRGGAGPVVRDLGALTQQGMADLQKAVVLKDLLPNADPLTRQSLQAEITRLEIKAAQTNKS